MDPLVFPTMKIVNIILVVLCWSTWSLAADILLLKNGDQLSGKVTLEADGQLSLTHDVLGTFQINSDAIQGGTVSVQLVNGDTLTGTLMGYVGGAWHLKPKDGDMVELTVDDSGGLVRIPEPVEPEAGTLEVHDDAESKEVTEEMKKTAKERIKAAKKVIEDAQKVLTNEWTGTISVGGSLSRGTAEASNLLLNIGIDRKVSNSETKIDAFYILNTNNEETTQNWFQASVDHYWDIPNTDSEWAIFGLVVFDWQEDVSWEQRVNGNLGLQYQFVNATRDPGTDWFEKMKLRARLGPGFRKEFAGENDQWALEALVGGTWDITFLQGVTLKGNAQFYPDLEDLGEFRVTANTNFMVALETLEGVSVGLGLRFQFQSQVAEDEEDFLLVISGQVAYDF